MTLNHWISHTNVCITAHEVHGLLMTKHIASYVCRGCPAHERIAICSTDLHYNNVKEIDTAVSLQQLPCNQCT